LDNKLSDKVDNGKGIGMQKISAADAFNALNTQINEGNYESAIKRLNELVKVGNKEPWIHRLLSLANYCEGRDKEALEALKAARELQPKSADEEIRFGRALAGKGIHKAALGCFLQALQTEQDNIIALSLVAISYERLGNKDTAKKYGRKVLKSLDAEAVAQKLEAVERKRPKPFQSNNRARNIISYSLFGDNTYYHDAALTAARMAPAIYPEWTCRFYCDPSIPKWLLQQLNRMGAQTLVAPSLPNDWMGLFWRFWAFDDPNVDVVLVRDVDSPYTVRERLAVDEWLASDFPFHVIRDHIWHMEPMMAGLWGGFTGLLPAIKPLTENFVSDEESRSNAPNQGERYKDQSFLRLNVWPRIRNATLTHDRYYQLGETRLPPEHPTEQYNHIGFSWNKKTNRNAYANFISLPE
jgi:tetratricopeptide (TPR) repeat protein